MKYWIRHALSVLGSLPVPSILSFLPKSWLSSLAKVVSLVLCLGIYGTLAAQEICNNGMDDDSDLLVDCDDPDCSLVTITDLTIGSCNNNNGISEVIIEAEIAWTGVVAGENIEVRTNGLLSTIDILGGVVSPQTVQFTLLANGSLGDTIVAHFESAFCIDTLFYDRPISCPTTVCPSVNPLIAHTYHAWHTGSGGGLDFNQMQTSGPQAGYPSTFSQLGIASNMTRREGGATYCHPATGEVLVYSDGEKAWDKDGNEYVTSDAQNRFNTMSTNLSSAAGTPIIIGAPGQCDMANELYIFFTDDHLGATPELYYVIVDVPNRSIGSVHQLTSSATSEQINAVQTNCDTIWIVHRDGPDLHAIRWTAGGFDPAIVSPDLHTSNDQRYRACFSLDGTRFAAGAGANLSSDERILVCDFDQNTGQFSNPFYLDPHAIGPPGVSVFQNYGLAFSPDGSKFYSSINIISQSKEYLLQFDLTAGSITDIQSSFTVIADKNGGIGGIQNGPDGRLYISNGDGSNDGTTTVHVVDFPNLAGSACNFRADFLDTGGQTGSGLNNIVYGLGPSSCIPLVDVNIGGDICSEIEINTNLNGCYMGAGGPYDVFYTINGVADTLFNVVPDGGGLILLSGMETGVYTQVYLTDAIGCASNDFDFTMADPSCPELCYNNFDDDLDGILDELDPDCCQAQAPSLSK
ncbi:MAG: hypothetical protein AAF985_19700 [Bacteroidota bacterium]